MPDSGARTHTRGHNTLGAGGERLAATWLLARGMRVLERNWRCSYGELDIIAEDGPEIVFVEVKTRRGQAMGTPEDAITPTKRKRLVASAQSYLLEHGWEDRMFRIDVVAVQLDPSGRLLEIRHYPRAVGQED